MPETLVTIRTQIAALLWDENNLIFKQTQLDQAVRSALAEYNLGVTNLEGPAKTIQDLDGAAVTTLPGDHTGLIVLGSAGFAAAGRGMDRAEAYDLNEETSEVLQKWGDSQLKEFRKMLSSVRTDIRQDAQEQRTADLRGASVAPWGEDSWKADLNDGEKY